jgi:hypothetical protein
VAWLCSYPWLDWPKMPLAAGDGIDDKGRSEDEMLVDGITGMDHEQVFQAN